MPTSVDQWTPQWAYAIGLLATDGCLGGGKTVIFTSKDLQLMETFRQCIGAQAPIARNGGAYRVQIGDIRFFRWLQSIGVGERKSLTLGALAVPRNLLVHTVRGLLDGDGSIYTGITIPNRSSYPLHQYQRLQVRFHSASSKHIEWLRRTIKHLANLDGWVTTKKKVVDGREYHPLWLLRYSKHESRVLLTWLYSDETAPRLERKWLKWVDFRDNGKPTRAYREKPSLRT